MLKNFRLTVFILSVFISFPAFSQDAPTSAASASSCCAELEELKADYFKDHRYIEFVDFLNKYKNKALPGCLNYYKALSYYNQLKYLEEKQLWDEYFAEGNTYRDQILENAKKAIAETDSSSCLRPKSRFLLWQFYRDQQATFGEQGLDELIADLSEYAKTANDPGLIKDIADQLLALDEKAGARTIYKLYVNKLASGQISDPQLKSVGAGFYKEGNLDLAETVYDIYIERISKSLAAEKLIPELFEVASLFVYKQTGLYDMPYAEKIYAKIDSLGQQNSFGQEAIYLRAFNLEKINDYEMAGELYSELVKLYPDTRHFDEVVYKIAMIDVYVSSDLQKARENFEKLIAKTTFSPQIISSFYQLGLLAQWEGDLVKAKGYYETLLKNAGDKYTQTVSLAKDRLKEIEEDKPINYNLKSFLDTTLKNKNALLELGRSELKISSFILDRQQKVTVSSLANMPQSGCNQVQVQYLWSGNLGSANPQLSDASFESAYVDPGTKEINMVVISSAGVNDCSFVMLDVY
jgi:tetratricopeptide (TPR) repeat protein